MTDVKALLLVALCLAAAGHDASGATQSFLKVTPIGSSLEIPATLIRPDGEGPFPALVILHDCSGLGPRSSGAPARRAADLVEQGYVVLIPDSFTPRGFADGVCFVPVSQSATANGYVRAGDAYGALAALRALPFVDGKRVGVMGGSHGGWTVLAAMFDPREDGNGPRALRRAAQQCELAVRPRRDHAGRSRGVGGRAEAGRVVFHPASKALTRRDKHREPGMRAGDRALPHGGLSD
jgi:hypothetical protein